MNFASSHFSSCRQRTSGEAASTQASTVGSRALTEFTFQVAIRIGSQVQTQQARMIGGREVFAYDAVTGRPEELPFDPFQTIPVDLNGDGLHELVRGTRHDGNCSGEVLDGKGRILGSVGDPVAMASKFMNLPGEQLLTYSRDGTLRIWSDAEAVDTEAALERYRDPFYALNQRAGICGNHLHVLGGV